jgi:hypothetical protein
MTPEAIYLQRIRKFLVAQSTEKGTRIKSIYRSTLALISLLIHEEEEQHKTICHFDTVNARNSPNIRITSRKTRWAGH